MGGSLTPAGHQDISSAGRLGGRELGCDDGSVEINGRREGMLDNRVRPEGWLESCELGRVDGWLGGRMLGCEDCSLETKGSSDEWLDGPELGCDGGSVEVIGLKDGTFGCRDDGRPDGGELG